MNTLDRTESAARQIIEALCQQNSCDADHVKLVAKRQRVGYGVAGTDLVAFGGER